MSKLQKHRRLQLQFQSHFLSSEGHEFSFADQVQLCVLI